VDLDRSLRTFRHGSVLVGGHPGRLITLSPEGVTTLASLVAEGTTSEATGQLARRLVDAGMAHPQPPGGETPAPAVDRSLTVVVPVHDRSESLDRCLEALGSQVPVVVVDDASDDPAAVAEVCRLHRTRLIRRTTNGGPAAARNDAVSTIGTELVAFVDSDCTVEPGWPGHLASMFDDPALGAVAPRVRPDCSPARRTVPALFTNDHSALDMGPEPSEVGPDRLVRYVPSAALLVRRGALGSGFDTHLRVGEDVDLVWRLLDDGWRVRYEPSVTVSHREPSSWWALWARRFRYGTSAGPLAQRHPGRLAPLELRPLPALTALAALAGRYRSATVLVAVTSAVLARNARGHGIPFLLSLRWSAEGVGWTVVGVGRAATMLAGPALILAMVRGRRTAVAAALLLGAPPVVEWWRRRPALGPLRWSLASIADDIAYGAGVWAGCLRSWSFGPLIPVIRLGQGGRSQPRVTPEAADLV
jgi:mycofactocin system glycosyltransferase